MSFWKKLNAFRLLQEITLSSRDLEPGSIDSRPKKKKTLQSDSESSTFSAPERCNFEVCGLNLILYIPTFLCQGSVIWVVAFPS